MGTGSPKSGLATSLMPMASGLPRWTGAPWARGKRLQTCTARTAWAGGDEARLGRADFGHVEKGAGFRVALAEEQEIEGQVTRHDDQVGLDVAEGQPRRRPGQLAGACPAANVCSAGVTQVHDGSLS